MASPLAPTDPSRWLAFQQAHPPHCHADPRLAVQFAHLVAAYTEPHRHYHTLTHLDHMLAIATSFSHLAADWQVVQLAIWYHDIVYNSVHAIDNETRSAAWASADLATLGLSTVTVTHVSDLILTTRTHLPTSDLPDAPLLLDADLAILAAPPTEYDAYAAAIRAEYAHVPDDAFRRGRRAVLEQFLQRPRLFHTSDLHARFDSPARANLRREIAALTTP